MKRAGIEVARTFIERVGDQVADAGLVRRILGGAAAEGVFHGDQRYGGVLNEPGLDATGRNQMLDLGRGLRGRRGQRQDRQADCGSEAEAPGIGAEIDHERFSSRFAAVSLIR